MSRPPVLEAVASEPAPRPKDVVLIFNKITDLATHIGWIHNNCLAIKNGNLDPGNEVMIVSFEKEQQSYAASIDKKADSNTNCPQLLEDRKAINLTEGYAFYILKQGTSKLDLGIGLVGTKPKLQKLNGQITGDINNDALLEYFTQCSSSEGIHFSVWSEKPYQGEPVWTGYYYLGYDIEPNCPEVKQSLVLSTQQVRSSDKLTLRFPQKHPSRLAIKDPKGIYFILHDEGIITRLMSHQKFMQATSLSMQVSEISGVTWINGKQTEKQVFSVPGEYMIYLADNLETEPENTFYLMKSIIYK